LIEEFKAELDYDSKEEIPLGMLGQDNPIKHYGEVVMYEDELGDKGYSKSNVRFRVMKDCFFVLLRSYTRVDHVCVRILDTRIFHKFSSNQPVIRDFSHRESTYAKLKSKGFKFSADWSLSPSQSDEIYSYLELKSSVTDRIRLD
jgi:type 2A phosphatase activator TIP41